MKNLKKKRKYNKISNTNTSIDVKQSTNKELPSRGYCMVFLAKKDWYELDIVDGNLVVSKPALVEDYEYKKGEWANKFYGEGKDKLLEILKENQIDYKIDWVSNNKQYIYIVVSANMSKIKEWVQIHNINVPIDPYNAVKIGRRLYQKGEFALAEHTYLDENEKKIWEQNSNNQHKLELYCWNNIHIRYSRQIEQLHPKMYKQKHKSVITDILYLRILYEILTNDIDLGGANFITTTYLSNSYHPLQSFFALNRLKKPKFISKQKCNFKCRTFGKSERFVEDIRNYYGENIGYYFAFLVHYTKWLIPMSIIGTIWFVVQISYNDTIAIPGSSLIVLIAIMWSTLMIENWFRREWALRFNWGMLKYSQIEIPRPSFEGTKIFSKENGELIETYTSWWCYALKITLSLSTMLLCLFVVIAFVVTLFFFRGQNRDNQKLSVGIGVANSIQIFIMNKLYTMLAYKLNEWEGHRLEQDYYNNLVIKRIIFIVINSFNSLFYLAFFDSNPLYDEDSSVRLEAVRLQLITLFLTALIIQNSIEVLVPIVITRIRKTVSKSSLFLYDNSNDSEDNKILLDIYQQIDADKSLDVLDNTAEIVVLHGYIMLFVVIFPLMPLLAYINNYFEIRIDFYNLINSQRAIPRPSDGLGVWKDVMACFNIIAIFSNLALITFRTELIKELDFMGNNDILDQQQKLIIFFFVVSLILLSIIFILRNLIDDKSQSTRESIARQEICEQYLLKTDTDTDTNHLTLKSRLNIFKRTKKMLKRSKK